MRSLLHAGLILAAMGLLATETANAADCVCYIAYISCYGPPIINPVETLSRAPNCPEASILKLSSNKMSSLAFPRGYFRDHPNVSIWVGDNTLTSLSGLKGWNGPGLSAENNLITSIDSSLLGRNLEYLYVENNMISSLNLSAAHKQRILYADNNYLEEITFPSECSLEILLLSGNSFNGVPDDILRCTKLKKLDVSKNTITEMPEAVVKLLTLRPTNWERGDFYPEIEVDLRDNPLSAASVVSAIQSFANSSYKLEIFWRNECDCATLRTKDKQYASVKFCVTSMCRENGRLWWWDLHTML